MLLMSVTFAVAAVRLAKRDTLVQQMSASESLAAVDTICVDKTGTLTDGELRLAGVEFADGVETAAAEAALAHASPPAPATATAPWRRSPSASPARPAAGRRRGPLLLGVEVERGLARLAGGGSTYVMGAPDVLGRGRGAGAAPGPGPQARGGDRRRAPRRRLRRVRRGAAGRRRRRAAAAADAAGAGRAGGDAAPRRGGDDRLHARGGSRPEADLRRRPRHRHRGRLRGRGAARGRRGRGPRTARRPRAAGRGRRSPTRSSAGSSRSRRRPWSRRWSPPGATWR